MPPSSEFSVIIPTCGRRRLDRTLAAVAGLNRSVCEVIVVDDGSSPALDVKRGDLPLRVVRQQRSGPAAARNRGAREARTPFLVFLDDDCAPHPAWIDEISAAAAPTIAVGGIVRNGLCENLFAEASHILVREFTLAQRLCEDDNYSFLPTANLAVHADAFRCVGGFDEQFPGAAGEDRDFCYRWRSRGYGLRIASRAVVDHFHDMDLREFVRQQFGYGCGARLFYRLHQEAPRTSRRFYRQVARTVLAERRWARAAGLGMLVAVSQTTSVLGYLRAGWAVRQ
jgi:GT2 family glycosyltransferase